MTEEDVIERVYKLLMVGDIGTGKTCLIKRYTQNAYSIHYKSTIGTDFGVKCMKWSDGSLFRLQLWDIAGQERFHSLTGTYYRDGVGGFVVIDITRFDTTLNGARQWKKDLDNKAMFMGTDNPIPVLLLVNKMDQINKYIDDEDVINEWKETKEKLDNLVRDHGFIGWVETSAKDNIGIDEAMRTLMTEVLKREKEVIPEEEPDISIINDRTLRKIDNRDMDNCCS